MAWAQRHELGLGDQPLASLVGKLTATGVCAHFDGAKAA
jgi:hypothetical protein